MQINSPLRTIGWRLMPLVYCLCLGLVSPAAFASTNLSAWVYPGPDGRLLYQPDALGNRILDASGIGYMGGAVPLPTNVLVKVIVSPVPGDNVANIQAAINQVQALPIDATGFRGAVLLTAGEYQLSNTITISASGVVLRGVGSSTNGTGTVLRATATNQYTLIEVSGSGSASTVGSTHNITNNYVPVGARSFNVDSTSGLAVGERVFIRRIATQQWIDDLGMNLLGPPPGDVPWTPSGYEIDMDRVITHIEGNRVFVDGPITCAIDAHYTNGTIRQFSWPGLITNVGIEHIYGVSDYFGNTTNENHGWTFIQFDRVNNGWVRDVVSQYFGYSCVNLNSGDKFITVQDSQCLDPISIITGGRRYAFAINDVQFCLIKNCYTRRDRHQFVTQSLTIGPNAFVDGVSDSANAEAGPHQRWATGILWDNITVNGNNLDAQNSGNFGSGHGWEGANCAIWNSAAKGFIVQNPPGAHNWLIGSIGPIQNGTAYVGPHDPGSYDSSGSSGTNVFPNSLYYSQLQDRLAALRLQSRDYWVGDIYQFTNSPPGGDVVPVDANWQATVQTAASSQPLDAFDVVTNSHWVPFTFNFTLGASEYIVGATLSLAMRAPTNPAANQTLYLGSLANNLSFSGLGWQPVSATNTTVRVLDLAGQLGLLTNGQFNVAVQGDVGLDWAMLELQVATNVTAFTNSLPPVADASVRSGTNAASNFGTATTLAVKQDSSANNQQQAYLRWDLSGVSGTIYEAKVVLTPVSVGTNAIEQGVAISTTDTWSETGITWNNQPGAGKRFATWIPGTGAPVQFVVTPQVLDAMAGDKQLSVQLYSLRNVGSAGEVDYASREYPDSASRPQLVLQVSSAPTNTPPVISTITNLTVAENTSAGPISFTIGDAQSPPDSLTLSASSSNTSLVPNANIVFGGSGSNRTVTLTPAPNQSGSAIITVMVTDPGGLAASEYFALAVTNATNLSGTFIWNGPGAGANNWSTSSNWSPAGPPGSLANVMFFDVGAAGVAISNVNNIVDFAFAGAIGSLWYGNTNGNHTTLISPSQTLTVNGGLTVGTETDNGNTQAVFATITGPGGTLNLNNTSSNLVVRQGVVSVSGNSALRATLDLSGLDTFNANVGKIEIGSLGALARVCGTLYLARANAITASGASPAIQVGGQGGGSGNSGNGSFLYLGQTNAIFANGISVATVKQGGCSMLFNPAVLGNSPAAYFRGADGVSPVPTWFIADSQSQGGTVNTTGTNDFSGGTIDALVGTLTVARSSTGTGVGNPVGLLTFDSGTINAGTLEIGYQGASGTNFATGTVNVNGTATLLVSTNLELGHIIGGTNATRGVLNVNGGSVNANTIICGVGTNTIAITAGVLAVTNTITASGPGLANFNLNNATLQLAARTGSSAVVVTNLVTGGLNEIDILSAPLVPAYPAQFTLIKYSGGIAGAGYNFHLGTLPPAPPYYQGYLSNNTANASVDLVLTTNVPPHPYIASISSSGTSLIITGTNGWPNGTYYVLASTNLAFPLTNWTVVTTNAFDTSGNFSFTNTVDPAAPQGFYLLQLQ